MERSLEGTVVHSDRGFQFRSNAFVSTLKRNGLAGSIGRVGASGDNAAMEPFNSPLQKNVLNQQRWVTREELRLAVVRHLRLHRGLLQSSAAPLEARLRLTGRVRGVPEREANRLIPTPE